MKLKSLKRRGFVIYRDENHYAIIFLQVVEIQWGEWYYGYVWDEPWELPQFGWGPQVKGFGVGKAAVFKWRS